MKNSISPTNEVASTLESLIIDCFLGKLATPRSYSHPSIIYFIPSEPPPCRGQCLHKRSVFLCLIF